MLTRSSPTPPFWQGNRFIPEFRGIQTKRAGFTLIELVMVMIILGIIGVAVLAPKQNLAGIRQTQALLKIKSDLRYAQGYALSTQKRTLVSFDLSGQTYSIYAETSAGSGTWSLTPIPDPLSKDNFTVAMNKDDFAGVTITGTNFNSAGNSLAFDNAGKPYGCSSSGSSLSALTSPGSVTLNGGGSVTVEPNTGKVQ